MTDDRPTPAAPEKLSPWKLTSGRIVLLILGALIALYTASALLGGLGNYQALREAAEAKRIEQQTAPAAPAAPAGN